MNKWFCIPVLLALGACSEKKQAVHNSVDEKIALIRTDRAFSDLSVAKGMKAAFIEYIDSNGVLLKPNHLPIVGANAIDFLIAQEDSGYTLNWQPQNGFVAQSGDLGYTYGVYALHPKNIDTVLYGTYVSIWKKQGDGSWKFVLDSGNEGIDSSDIAF
jgi:ketosteroid isomerase-like protein